MSLLSQSIRQQHNSNIPDSFDMGLRHGVGGSFRMGFKESVGDVAYNWGQRMYLGHQDQKAGLGPLDEDQFKEKYGENTGFEYNPDETPSQTELRFKDYIDTQVQSRRAQDVNAFVGFGAGMAGNMANPVDLGLAFIPYAGAAKMAKAASVSVRTGRSIQQSAKVIERLSRDPMTQALVSGEKIGRGRIMANLTKGAFAEQTVENAFVWVGSQQIGREYGMLDFAADSIFGGVLVTGMNLPGANRIKRIADSVGVDIYTRNTLDTMAAGGNLRGMVDVLQSYSDEVSGGFNKAVDANPRIRAILDMKESDYAADPTAAEDLRAFIYENREAVWLANLKGVIPLDTRLPLPQARAKQHMQMHRIVEHQRGRDVELTPEELQIKADLTKKNQELIDRVSPERKGPTVEELEADLALTDKRTKRAKELRKEIDDLKLKTARDRAKAEDAELADPLDPRNSEFSFNGNEGKMLAELEELRTVLESPEKFSADQVEDARIRFENDYLNPYLDEIRVAQGIVKRIFGIKIKPTKVAKIQSKDPKKTVFGRYEYGSRTIEITDVISYFDNQAQGRITPAQLVFHEAIHTLSDTDAKAWVQLTALIQSDPALRAKLDTLILEGRRYDEGKLMDERPSVLMEWAVAQPEFWKALQKGDPKLFQQFRDFIVAIFKEARALLGADSRNLNITQAELEKMTPEQLAKRVGEIMNEARVRNSPDIANLNLENVQKAASKAEESIEAQTRAAEQQQAAAEKEVIKEVENTAKKATKAPHEVAAEQIPLQLRGELGTIAADTKIDPRDLRTRVTEFLGANFDKDSKLFKEYEELMDRILAVKSRSKKRYEHAQDVLERNLMNPDPSTAGEELAVRLYRLRNEVADGMSEREAWEQAEQFIDQQNLQESLLEIRNFNAQRQNDRLMEGKTEKTKLKTLKSFLDGLQRTGVKLGKSAVSVEVSSQMTKDMAKLRKAFVDYGFLEYLDDAVARVEGESDMDWRARQQARKDASNDFMWDLMEYYRTGEVPAKYGKDTDSFKAVGDAMTDTLHSQIAQLNELGASINLRQDHLGVSFRWDGDTIRKMGRADFKKHMKEILDEDMIRESHGGVMVGRTNEFGFAETFVEFDFEEYLDAWFIESTSPVKSADHSSMNIAKSFSKSRMVHVKPGKEREALLRFSGHDNLGRLLQDQIRHRSEMIAVSRKLGNEPLPNFEKMLDRYGLKKGVNTTREGSGSRIDRVLRDTGFAGRFHDWDLRHTMDTAKFITGALDNPANHDLSFWGKTLRQISHLAFLWTSTISAISDIPLTLSTLDQLGATNGFGDLPTLLGAMQRAASRRFHGNGQKLRQFYEGSGAGFDAVKNAGARRMALAEGSGDTIIGRASEKMFSINGLNSWTAIMQEAFTDILTERLAHMAHTGNWDPHMRFTMESMGFTAEDFTRLADGIEDINGVNRVGPPSFAGTDLEMKLLNFFTQFRDQAVIIPDASTQALVRFGTQAGTPAGEAIRVLMQYASFPVAMNRITMRKLIINHGGTRPWTQGQLTLGRMITYMGSMMAFAYLAMVMKDMARARGPVMPWEMTGDNWMRLMDQSGMLGAIGMIVQGASEGRPSALVSPNVSTGYRVGHKLITEGFGSALYAGRAYTGDNVPFVGSAVTSALAYVFQGSYAEALRIGVNFREMHGTEQFFPVPNP